MFSNSVTGSSSNFSGRSSSSSCAGSKPESMSLSSKNSSTLVPASSRGPSVSPLELARIKLDSYKFPVRGELINCIPPWRGNPDLVFGRIPPREEARSSGFRKFLKSNEIWDTSSVSTSNSASSFLNPFDYKVREAPTFHHFMKTTYCPSTYERPKPGPKIRRPLSPSSEDE